LVAATVFHHFLEALCAILDDMESITDASTDEP
jgi:hypothetical protein